MAESVPEGHPPRKFYGWKNVGLLFFIQFGASGFVFFAYASIFPAMVEAMEWNRGTASIAQSISLLVLGLFYPLTAWMIGKWGVRNTLTIGLAVMLVGMVLIVGVVTEIWQWTLIWGLVIGLSLSLTAPICGQTLMIHWFNVRRATVIGIIMSGNALGGFVAQPVVTSVMQRFGDWRAGWITSAIVVFLAILLARFLINRPSDIGQHPDNIDPFLPPSDNDPAPKAQTYRSEHNWSLKQVFRTRVVYMVIFINITYLATGNFMIAHGALHLSDIGITKLETASLVSIFILGSGLGRIPAGILGDRVEMRWLMTAIMAVMLLTFTLFGALDNFAALAICGFVFGAGYGGFFAIAPALTSNYFGEDSFAKINAVFAPALLPFVAAVPFGAGYIFEAQGSYDTAFLIGSIMLALSVIASALLKPPVMRVGENAA